MIKNEKISLIKTLPIGSYFITNDLVKILNVSYDFADKLKISHINLGLNEKKND
jgi:cell division ATPase FtsA